MGNEKFKWIVGLYYMDDRFASLPLVIYEGDYGPSGLTYTMVDVYVREPTRSYAEFGQATWEFLPDTHLTLGVRNTDDTKSIGGNTLVDGFDAVHGRQTADFSKVTYRAVLDRQFTPDILGYVSWNTGFKSGQYSLVNFTEPPVKPEVLTAYETGFKTEFLDRRLRVNASAFDYKYQDIQVQEVVVGGTQLVNAMRRPTPVSISISTPNSRVPCRCRPRSSGYTRATPIFRTIRRTSPRRRAATI